MLRPMCDGRGYPTGLVQLTSPRYQHRLFTVEVREESLELFDLGKVMNDDVRIGRILLQKILVIVLRRIKLSIRLDLGHNGGRENTRLIELTDVGPRDFHLV